MSTNSYYVRSKQFTFPIHTHSSDTITSSSCQPHFRSHILSNVVKEPYKKVMLYVVNLKAPPVGLRWGQETVHILIGY